MEKIKCCKCNKIALWFYAPSSKGEDAFYCDDCVPRGCSCNQYALSEFDENEEQGNKIYWNEERNNFTNKKTEDSFFYEIVDDKGRRYPCCEYWYDEDGWEDEKDD